LAGLIGGDGDCGGQKCAKDHVGSVASVDEMRARLAVGGGERGAKQKRVRCHGRIILKLRWARQGRGGGPRCGVAWRSEWGRERGAMSRGRPNRGGERGLTGGSRPQYRVAALADRRARAA
jgi:hypothetical protein